MNEEKNSYSTFLLPAFEGCEYTQRTVAEKKKSIFSIKRRKKGKAKKICENDTEMLEGGKNEQ